ncbi:hypothetical protein KBZ21_29485 [Streptomyces sp. A73]|nr:hypothetical protein [Streptomyces sp. A73]
MRALFPTTFPTTLAAGVLAASASLGGLVVPDTAEAATRAAADRVPASADPAQPSVRAEADRLMKLTYRQFAEAPHRPPFDWTTDGCSVPTGQFPYSKVFRPVCVQHDFGYRNYGGNGKLKLDPTRRTKNWIDGRFRTELRRICDHEFTDAQRNRNCRNAADTYYLGVQLGGDSAFFPR